MPNRKPSSLERLHVLLNQLVAERKDELVMLKARGIPIVGYFCNYTPRELIAASGAVAIRLAEGGSYESRNLGEKHIRADACPFCKSCLGSFETDPIYKFVTVVVISTLCDQMRRLGEVIHRRFGIPVLQMSVPRTSDDDSTRSLYHHEVRWLQHELEHLTGEPITGEALGRAALHEEEKRSLLRAFNDTRKRDPPPVSESDMLRLVSATNLLTAPDCSALLRHNLISIGVRLGTEGAGADKAAHPSVPSSLRPSKHPRLMLAGSIIAEHDLELVEMIEERAAITTDLVCNGVRTFLDPLDVPVTSDADTLLEALVNYYFSQPGCIQRRPNRGYYELARRLTEEFRVAGVVLKTLLFCDAHNFEAVRFAKEVSLPLLHLDTDYGERNREQIRTRVEAFLETL